MSLRLTKKRRPAALFIYTKIVKGFLITLFFTAIIHNAAADARLIMVTSEYCPYCQAWERDVGAVFNKSPYAAKLPLTRVEIGSKMPKNVVLKKPIIGTPTFLIIRNGREIDRQRGYVDEEIFYWWLSEHMAE
jgi:thioredoxin-related protein